MVAWALGLGVEGCAANQGPELPSGPDAGGDEGSLGDGAAPNQGVRLVVVNGLTRAAAVSDAGKPVRDARLCLQKQGLALPSEGTMPLASYPGVARGRGVDLGQVLSAPLAGKVRIDVFDADAVRLSTSSSSSDCTKLTDPQAGFAYVPSATLSVTLVSGVNLLVLRDDPAGGVAIEQAVLAGTSAASVPDAGPSPIRGQFGVFTSWLAADASVTVALERDGGGATLVSAVGVGKVGPTAPATISLASVDGYETASLRFTPSAVAKPGDVAQTLGSIQYVSDPTTSPAAFFDRRQSVVFVLVGDPADTTALTVDGGRKAVFDGAELHILAVPYLN